MLWSTSATRTLVAHVETTCKPAEKFNELMVKAELHFQWAACAAHSIVAVPDW